MSINSVTGGVIKTDSEGPVFRMAQVEDRCPHDSPALSCLTASWPSGSESSSASTLPPSGAALGAMRNGWSRRIFRCLLACALAVGIALEASAQGADHEPVTLKMSTHLEPDPVTGDETFIFIDLLTFSHPFPSGPLISYDPQEREFDIGFLLSSDEVVDKKFGLTEVSFSPALAPTLSVNDAEFYFDTYEVIDEQLMALGWIWRGVTADFQDGGWVTLTIRRGGPSPIRPDAGVCNRTPQVQDAIFSALNNRVCKDITTENLASIKYLPSLSGKNITALKSGDFAGLAKLETLELGGNDLTTLRADVFAGLSNLEKLNLHGNNLTALPVNVFAGLSSLEVLLLGDNSLTALDVSLFAGLSRLGWLDLSGNRLAALPSWVFRGLANLKRLDLQDNQLIDLPLDIFAGLASLGVLYLERNHLATLPAGVFADLSSLRRLNLEHNRLSMLPDGLFTGLSLGSRLVLGPDLYLPLGSTTYLGLGSNPGVPFSLSLGLERRDQPNPTAPGPAAVGVTLVPDGGSPMSVPLPFDLPLGMWVRGGTLSGSARIAAGHTASKDITVYQRHPDLGVPTDDPVTVGLYVDSWIDSSPHGFRSSGIRIAHGRPLELFGNAVIPLVKSASNPNQQGFVRIINHSDRAGTVRIHAIDDSGGRFGPISLSLAAKETAHFSSSDLEQGNASKGLAGGVGDGDGDWRLELDTDLDIEPLAYIRTADGFVTSIHDMAAEVAPGRYRVPIFNPGSNRSQVSLLRLVNPGDRDAEIVVNGLDDRGEPPPEGNVRLTLATGTERTLTARQLEQGGSDFDGRFGDGAGKWQLSVSADQPIQVLSLLLSPTENLTNLSRGTSTDQRTLPLVTPASNAIRQGFVRIINHSERAGTVRIHAIDDSGQRFGPVPLSLAAKETAHFNSRDLEQGNASKGLPEGVGDGDGDWRLELDTELDIEPLAYVRTADGFVTSIHDVAAEVAPGRYRVPIFNPGSNRSQVSLLRLINRADTDAEVEIIGLDDRGEPPEGRVRLTLPAGTARTISAQELESGGTGFSGSLGDGTGKWQLSVFASRPIQLMNLLRSPTGHLANLTTSTSGFDFGPPTNDSNRPPENTLHFIFQNLTLGTPITFDVSRRFRDPDGDILRYTATSSDTSVVTASVSGNAVTITPVSVGVAGVTMTAHDPYGATATQTTEMRVGEG